MLLLLICAIATAAIIGRDVPIQLEYSNANMYSAYKFTMSFQTAILYRAYLFIEFPSFCYNHISLNTISKAYINSNSTAAVTIKGNTVIVEMPGVQSSVVYNIELLRILNPTIKGGTGQFRISTRKYIDSISDIEYNHMFGSVGFANDPKINYQNTLPSLFLYDTNVTISATKYATGFYNTYRIVFPPGYASILDVDYSCKVYYSTTSTPIDCYGSSIYNAIYISEPYKKSISASMSFISIGKSIGGPKYYQLSMIDIIKFEVFSPNSTILIDTVLMESSYSYINQRNSLQATLDLHQLPTPCIISNASTCKIPTNGKYGGTFKISLPSLSARYIVINTPFSTVSYCSVVDGAANDVNKISSCTISSLSMYIDGIIPLVSDIKVFIEFDTLSKNNGDTSDIEIIAYLSNDKIKVASSVKTSILFQDLVFINGSNYIGMKSVILSGLSLSIVHLIATFSSAENSACVANFAPTLSVCTITAVTKYTCIAYKFSDASFGYTIIACFFPTANTTNTILEYTEIYDDLYELKFQLSTPLPSSYLYANNSTASTLLQTNGAFLALTTSTDITFIKKTSPLLTDSINSNPKVDCYMLPALTKLIKCFVISALSGKATILITNFDSLPVGTQLYLYLGIQGLTPLGSVLRTGIILADEYIGKQYLYEEILYWKSNAFGSSISTVSFEPAITNTYSTATFNITAASNKYCLLLPPSIGLPLLRDDPTYNGYMSNLAATYANITCNTVLGTNVSCIAFPQISKIFVNSISNTSTKVIVNNVLMPSSMFSIHTSSESNYVYYPSKFASVVISTNNNYALYPYSIYQVIFTIQDSPSRDLKEGSSIHIKLPSSTFPLVYPAVVDFYFPECTLITSDSDVTCKYDRKSNEFIISGYRTFPVLQSYTAELRGVTNPPTNGQIDGFEMTVIDAYGLLSYRSQNISGPMLKGKKQPGEIALLSHKMEPSIIGYNNTHYFMFTTQNSLSRKSTITVKYPQTSVRILNLQKVTCHVTLAESIIEIFQCAALNNSIFITVNEIVSQDTLPKQPIAVSIYPIYVINQGTYKTDEISVSVDYNLLSIDKLYSTASFYEILYSTTYVDNFQVNPYVLNSGEQAWYGFSFYSQASIESKGCLFEIDFPMSYPKYIGKSLYSDMYFSVSSDEYKLIISPLQILTQNIQFNVYGIINPNLNNYNYQDPFGLVVICDGIPKESGLAYIESSFLHSPLPMNLNYINGISSACNDQSDLQIAFTQGNTGALLSNFYIGPSLNYKGTMAMISAVDDSHSVLLSQSNGYDVLNSKLYYSDPATKNMGDMMLISNNKYMYLQGAILIIGVGNTMIKYSTYKNPPLSLKFYNSTSKQYAVSTYTNLNTITIPSCQTQSQIITINDGNSLLSVPKGYSSDLINVQINNGARGVFSLSISIPIDGIRIEPPILNFDTGDAIKTFKILSSSMVPTATYKLNVTIHSSKAYLYTVNPSNIYASIHNVQKLYTISAVFSGQVKQSSCSEMIKVTTSIRPYNPIFIIIKQITQYPTGLSISPNLIELNSTMPESAFKICISDESQGQKGKISFTIRNPGFNPFYNVDLLNFNVEKSEVADPSITSITLQAAGLHSLSFTVTFPDYYDIYYGIYEYMDGVSSLTSKELLNGYLSTYNMYKYHQFGKYINTLKVTSKTITINKLRSSKPHMFTAVAIDTNGRYSDLSSVMGTTSQDNYPIKVSIPFTISLSSYLLSELAIQIANIIGVKSQRIIPTYVLSNSYDYTSSIGEFVILPHKSDERTNAAIATTLLSSFTLLKQFISTVDDTSAGTSEIWYPIFPKFKQLPTIRQSECSIGYVKIEGIKLTRPGIVHGIAIPLNLLPKLTGSKRVVLTDPESIVEGYDSKFEAIPSSSVVFSESEVSLEMSGLTCGETYAFQLLATDGLEENGVYPFKDSIVALAYRMS